MENDALDEIGISQVDELIVVSGYDPFERMPEKDKFVERRIRFYSEINFRGKIVNDLTMKDSVVDQGFENFNLCQVKNELITFQLTNQIIDQL